MFLGLGRVILCAKCFPFSALADGCTRAPGTAIPHVRRPRFAQLAKQTEPKNRAEPRGVILCVLVTTAKDGTGIRQLS